MTTIQPGAHVLVRTAGGGEVEALALTGVEQGGDFPVVWVCRPERLAAARAAGKEPEGVPCPANDVRPAEAP